MEQTAQHVSIVAAFLAGLLSFISPCVIPLVPSYVSFITGLSVDQLTNVQEKRRLQTTIMASSLSFILGFSVVFITLGASASLLGRLLITYQNYLRIIGGILIILFGLYLTGLLNLSFLLTEKRLHIERRPVGYLGSFVIGIGFAAGWTPCVGPVLGSILLYAGTTGTVWQGIVLLVAYSLGLGIPLLTVSFGLNRFLLYFKQMRQYLQYVSVVMGLLLIGIGVLLAMNAFGFMASLLDQYGIGWYVDLPIQ